MRRFAVITAARDPERDRYHVGAHHPDTGDPLRLTANEVTIAGGHRLNLARDSCVIFEGRRIGLKPDTPEDGAVQVWL